MKNRLCYIPIQQIVTVIGRQLCQALSSLHDLTGCDSTSTLFGIGEKQLFASWLNAQSISNVYHDLETIYPQLQLQSTHVRRFCAACTLRLMLLGSQEMICDIVCSAKRVQKVNLYHQHRTVSGCTFKERITSVLFGKKHFVCAMQNLPAPIGHGWKLCYTIKTSHRF